MYDIRDILYHMTLHMIYFVLSYDMMHMIS